MIGREWPWMDRWISVVFDRGRVLGCAALCPAWEFFFFFRETITTAVVCICVETERQSQCLSSSNNATTLIASAVAAAAAAGCLCAHKKRAPVLIQLLSCVFLSLKRLPFFFYQTIQRGDTAASLEGLLGICKLEICFFRFFHSFFLCFLFHPPPPPPLVFYSLD